MNRKDIKPEMYLTNVNSRRTCKARGSREKPGRLATTHKDYVMVYWRQVGGKNAGRLCERTWDVRNVVRAAPDKRPHSAG